MKSIGYQLVLNDGIGPIKSNDIEYSSLFVGHRKMATDLVDTFTPLMPQGYVFKVFKVLENAKLLLVFGGKTSGTDDNCFWPHMKVFDRII